MHFCDRETGSCPSCARKPRWHFHSECGIQTHREAQTLQSRWLPERLWGLSTCAGSHSGDGGWGAVWHQTRWRGQAVVLESGSGAWPGRPVTRDRAEHASPLLTASHTPRLLASLGQNMPSALTALISTEKGSITEFRKRKTKQSSIRPRGSAPGFASVEAVCL